MKRLSLLATLLFGLLFTMDANATHSAGADLYYECLGNNQYQFTLVYYYDCAGTASPPTSPSLSLSGCGFSGSVSLSQQSATEITPICPSQSSTCSGGSYPGYEQYVYTGIYTLPFQCADWQISYSLCCRNNQITTLSSPGGENIYVEEHFDNLNFPCNNSPTFTNPPVSFLCSGQPYCFNPGAYDSDGDSLVYSLVNPLDASGVSVVFAPGYSATNPLSTVSGVTIDPNTGAVCFTPNGAQVAVMAIQVDQYDPVTGALIGYVIRDVQLNVIANCANTAPDAEGFDGNPWVAGNNDTLNLCAGQNINVTVNSTDPNGDPITITPANLPTGAIFTDNGNGSWTLDWTPSASQAFDNVFTVTYSDDACPYAGTFTATYNIYVQPGTTTGVADTVQICGDMVAELDAQNGQSFTWSVLSGDPMVEGPLGVGGNNFTCSSCDTTSAKPSVTTTYVVTSNFIGLCGNTDTVTVEVVTNLGNLTVFAGNDTTLCEGDQFVIPAEAYADVNGSQVPMTVTWTPAGGLSDPNVINPTFNGTTGQTYTLDALDENNCPASDQVTISVTPAFTVTEVITDDNCSAGVGAIDLTVSGPGSYTYDWSGPNGFTASTQDVSSLQIGTYNVTVSDPTNTNCDFTATYQVGDVPNNITIATTTVDETCDGFANGSAVITPDNGGSATTWTIDITDPNTNVTTYTSSPVSLNNLAPGTYSVTVVNAVGCGANDQFTINPGLVVGFTWDTTGTICFQPDGAIEVFPFGGTGTPTFTLSGQNMGTDTYFDNLTPGPYFVEMILDGCPYSENITVPDMANSLTPIVTYTEETCTGMNNATISVELPFADSVAFTINNGTNVTILGPMTSDTATFYNLAPGSYLVNVDGLNCPWESTEIVLGRAPAISWDGLQTYAVETDCQQLGGNGSVSAAAQGGWVDQYTYQWFWLPDDTTMQTTNPTWGNRPAGDYMVIATEDSTGCTIDTILTVNEFGPVALFDVDTNWTTFPHSFTFENLSTDATSWTWEIISNNGDTVQYSVTDQMWTPDSTVANADTMTVCLHAYNNFGCEDSYCEVIVLVNPFKLRVPNAFTPNNKAPNNLFFLDVDGIQEYEVVIFNRWGRKIKVLDINNRSWDGLLENGMEASEGVYLYNYRVVTFDGTEYTGQSSLHLIRR